MKTNENLLRAQNKAKYLNLLKIVELIHFLLKPFAITTKHFNNISFQTEICKSSATARRFKVVD